MTDTQSTQKTLDGTDLKVLLHEAWTAGYTAGVDEIASGHHQSFGDWLIALLQSAES